MKTPAELLPTPEFVIGEKVWAIKHNFPRQYKIVKVMAIAKKTWGGSTPATSCDVVTGYVESTVTYYLDGEPVLGYKAEDLYRSLHECKTVCIGYIKAIK